MRKNAPASPEGSEAAGKARNPEKRAFSLPYISHNVHYTKLMSLKNRPPLLLCSTRTALPGGSFFVSVSGRTPLQVQAMCVAPGLVYSGSGVISKYVQMAS